MDRYELGHSIGRGSYGEVYLCRKKDESKHFDNVMKKICMSSMSEVEKIASLKEVEVLSKLKHPCIVSYIDHFFEVCLRRG